MAWVWRNLKDHLILNPPLWAGTPCTRLGYSKPVPNWSWTPPGTEVYKLSGQPFPVPQPPHSKEFLLISKLNLPPFSLKSVPLVQSLFFIIITLSVKCLPRWAFPKFSIMSWSSSVVSRMALSSGGSNICQHTGMYPTPATFPFPSALWQQAHELAALTTRGKKDAERSLCILWTVPEWILIFKRQEEALI